MIHSHPKSQNTTESEKKENHLKSLATPDEPTNRCTRTSDRSGPTYIQHHHPHLLRAQSLQHLANEVPPPEGSSAIRHFEVIFGSIFKGVNGLQYQCICCSKTSERLHERGRKCKEVPTLAFGIWLGIVVYIGAHNYPAVQDYWRHDGLIKSLDLPARLNLRRKRATFKYLLINQRKHRSKGDYGIVKCIWF